MKRFLVLLVPALLLAKPETLPHDNWQPHLDIHGRTNGYRRGAGMTLFTPVLESDCTLLFGQGYWGRWYNNWTGGAGVGLRRMVTPRFAWGVNGFVDVARSNNNHSYLGVGLGGELLGNCLEARVNGYYPFSNQREVEARREASVTAAPREEGGLLLTQCVGEWDRYENAYRGFDLELGAGMPLGCDLSGWIYAGYKQFHSRHARDILGPRARVEFRLDNFLGLCGAQAILGGFYEYDRLFRSEGGVELGIRIPLSGPACSNSSNPSCLYRRMGNGVVRAESILLHRRERCRGVTENQLGEVLVLGGEAGEGTFESPAPLSSSLEGYDVVVVAPGLHQLKQPLSLEKNQILVGASHQSLTLSGVEWKLPETKRVSTLVAPEGEVAVELAPQTRVENLQLRSSLKGEERNFEGRYAIEGKGASGATIRHLNIRGTAGAIHLDGGERITLESVKVLQASEGLHLRGQGEVTVKGLQLDEVNEGILLTNAEGTYSVQELLLRKSGKRAIALQGGAPKLSVSGKVLESGGLLADIQGTSGGQVELEGLIPGMAQLTDMKAGTWKGTDAMGMRGEQIQVKNAAGPVVIRGVQLGKRGAEKLTTGLDARSSDVRVEDSLFLNSKIQGEAKLDGCHLIREESCQDHSDLHTRGVTLRACQISDALRKEAE